MLGGDVAWHAPEPHRLEQPPQRVAKRAVQARINLLAGKPARLEMLGESGGHRRALDESALAGGKGVMPARVLLNALNQLDCALVSPGAPIEVMCDLSPEGISHRGRGHEADRRCEEAWTEWATRQRCDLAGVQAWAESAGALSASLVADRSQAWTVACQSAKGGQESVHPLHGPELRALRPLQMHSPYVFVTEGGTSVTTAWFLRMIQRTGVAAKMPFQVHPHMLRHSTGYKLANDGHDTRSLAHYLGHRNLQSTARYTALAPDRFRDFWRD
jgi:hypothetical protein